MMVKNDEEGNRVTLDVCSYPHHEVELGKLKYPLGLNTYYYCCVVVFCQAISIPRTTVRSVRPRRGVTV